MTLLLLLFCSLFATQGSSQQIDKKQFVNLGDSFNFEGDGIEDGFSRGLSDNALGADMGTDNNAGSQMHITENSQGGLNLGDLNSDSLGGLGSLLGGSSVSPYSSMNSMSSLSGNDDMGLGESNGELYGKDNNEFEALAGGKDILGGTGDQMNSFTGSDKSEDSSDANTLLSAFGLGAKTGAKSEGSSDSSLDSLASLHGDKQQSLMSLLNMGQSSSSENSQTKGGLGQASSDNSFNGLNLDAGSNNNNVESTANLGDSLNPGTNTDMLGINKNDLAALLGGSSSTTPSASSSLASSLKDIKGSDNINDGSLGILQKLLSGATTTGDDRQGIGDFGDGNLANELSQLDTTDQKLEKLLENGKADESENGESNLGEHGGDSAEMDSQPSKAQDETPSMGYHGMNGMQQMSPMLGNLMGSMGMAGMGGMGGAAAMGGMGGAGGMGGGGGMGGAGGMGMDGYGNMVGQHGMHIETGATVHAHASDKPGHSAPVSPAEASKPAKLAQKVQEERHKKKVKQLKQRLNTLREKLNELEEEQSKKSHSVDSPAAKRKDAIKKLLIKNLKLAAMIASKEIQLEEAKQSTFTAKKKESDDLGLIDIPSNLKENKDSDSDLSAFSKAKAKPLTDLSKKAEEEVNHLTKSKPDNKAKKEEEKSSSANKKARVTNNDVLDNSTIIRQINATLEKLSAGSPQNSTVSPKAYKRLVQRITQMSPKKSEAVQEAALSSLYKALMKTKKTNKVGTNKKLAIKYENVGCYKDKEKRLLSSLESSFKSPLDKNYKTRLNALYKCARIAKLKGYPGFAIENGGQCFGGKSILKKYQQYGPSLACNKSGKGGPWSLNIYKLVQAPKEAI